LRGESSPSSDVVPAGFEVSLDAGRVELTPAEIVVAMLRAAMGILPYALLAFALTAVGRSTALGATGVILFMIIETTVLGIFGALGGIWADLRVLTIGHSAASLSRPTARPGAYEVALRETPDPSEPRPVAGVRDPLCVVRWPACRDVPMRFAARPSPGTGE
jgi:hypothetical protein